MHGDWHHRNVLVEGSIVTTIIDWESARAGDARYDLVVLNYWTDTYEGGGRREHRGHATGAAHGDPHVPPDARRLLAALVGLHQLWFVDAHRQERLDDTVDRVRRHLAGVAEQATLVCAYSTGGRSSAISRSLFLRILSSVPVGNSSTK